MSKKLAYSVTLWNPSVGAYENFLPGMELPAWAEGLVRNPRAFELEEGAPVAGVDYPVPGSSVLSHQVEKGLQTSARAMTGSGIDRSSGTPITEKFPKISTVNAQPTMHDSVAKAAVRPLFANEAAEEEFKLRNGLVASDLDLKNAKVLREDQEMNDKAAQQQVDFAAAQASAALDAAMAVQAAASVQAATALSAVPGAAEVMAEKVAAKKAAPKKSDSSE